MPRKVRCERFVSSEGGNVAMLFALALVPLIGMGGAAVDYARGSDYRVKLNRAADAAALAAAKERTLTPAQRRELAEKVFRASFGSPADFTLSSIGVEEIGSGVRVTAQGEMTNQLMQVLGFKTTTVGTFAEAMVVDRPTEIALVLDNTGSMVNDMAHLRKAATQFTDTVFANASGDLIRIGVVPYVAAVNPGRANLSMSWMDSNADSQHHGMHLRGRHIANMVGCDPDPFPKPPAPSGGGGGGGGGGGPSGPVETDKEPKGKDRNKKSAELGLKTLALELFGIKPAHAQVTPQTSDPNAGTSVKPPQDYKIEYRPDGGSATIPTGFQWGGKDNPCRLYNPPKVSHFDLFQRVSGTSWKGCVEARPEPYDVTDDAPTSGSPNTLFVPYFWPDEPGQWNNATYANTYMDDGALPTGWTGTHSNGSENDWLRFPNLFKYTLAAKTKINENPPNTSGPNASCPDEVLPLTKEKATVSTKIKGLSHWEGGGTMSSEGLMWGWRVLSPGAPFTEGAAYGKAKKYIVLMTDGLNSFSANVPNGPTRSDYSAYGYLRHGRLASDWFTKGEQYLDSRMRAACDNIKKTGIEIMTILFRETDANTQTLLRDCASDPKLAYIASNEAELSRAFVALAGEITRLRLTK